MEVITDKFDGDRRFGLLGCSAGLLRGAWLGLSSQGSLD